jgi:ketosteroid isomerase-like protein
LSALRSGDRRAAVAALARDACFVTPDSTVIRGRADISAILAQLGLMGMELEAEARGAALIAGDTAFCSERWTVRCGAEGPERLVRSFFSQSVSIRVEGRWKLLIVAPWGWGERGAPRPKVRG